MMNKLILTSLATIISASVTFQASAKSSDIELRQGRAQQSQQQSIGPLNSQQKSQQHRHGKDKHSKGSHKKNSYSGKHLDWGHGGAYIDPAQEMRRALKHLWKEHRYHDSYGRRKRHDDDHHYRSKRRHSADSHSRGLHSKHSYSRGYGYGERHDPHFVRYYDNDFYVYINDRYYQDHYRGPWWGHYHQGDYCRTKHRYLMHDDVRNLLMLGLVIDLVH